MLNRTIAKFLFYGVAMALPGQFWLVPLLGLVVFDVGMIAWLFVFLSRDKAAQAGGKPKPKSTPKPML